MFIYYIIFVANGIWPCFGVFTDQLPVTTLALIRMTTITWTRLILLIWWSPRAWLGSSLCTQPKSDHHRLTLTIATGNPTKKITQATAIPPRWLESTGVNTIPSCPSTTFAPTPPDAPISSLPPNSILTSRSTHRRSQAILDCEHIPK